MQGNILSWILQIHKKSRVKVLVNFLSDSSGSAIAHEKIFIPRSRSLANFLELSETTLSGGANYLVFFQTWHTFDKTSKIFCEISEGFRVQDGLQKRGSSKQQFLLSRNEGYNSVICPTSWIHHLKDHLKTKLGSPLHGCHQSNQRSKMIEADKDGCTTTTWTMLLLPQPFYHCLQAQLDCLSAEIFYKLLIPFAGSWNSHSGGAYRRHHHSDIWNLYLMSKCIHMQVAAPCAPCHACDCISTWADPAGLPVMHTERAEEF